MALIFFVYGLAFFTMGAAVAVYPKHGSGIKAVRALGFLSGFGLLHGINEWADFYVILAGSDALAWVLIARAILLPVSFAFLMRFGIEAASGDSPDLKSRRFVPVALMAVWAVFSINTGMSGADILARYFLGLPGAFLAGVGLYKGFGEGHAQGRGRTYVALGAGAFLSYAVFSGLIVPKAGFFPASVLNYGAFRDFLGIPVQAARALCAIIIMFSMLRILSILGRESEEKTRFLLAEAVEARNSLASESEKLLHIFDKSPDPIIMLDREFRVLYANRRAYSDSALGNAALFGDRCYEALWSRKSACPGCMAEESFRTGQSRTRLRRKDRAGGNREWVWQFWHPVPEADGAHKSMVEILRNLGPGESAGEDATPEYIAERLAFLDAERAALAERLSSALNTPPDGTPRP